MSMDPDDLSQRRVLLVDDELHVLNSLSRLLRKEGYTIHTATSGEEALERVRSEAYAVVVCDQRMPGMSGVDVLRGVRDQLPHATRITLTGYTDIEPAIRSVNEGGVQHFLLKPWDNDQLRQTIRDGVSQYTIRMAQRAAQTTILMQRNELSEINASLEARVLERTSDLAQAHEETLRALVVALDAREKTTAGHSWRVAVFAIRLAIAHGLPEESLEDLYRGAILHDIGKIGIPDEILLKAGPLTDEERALMQEHVRVGAAILEGVEHLNQSKDIPLYHHEKYNGTGYPHRLAGESIPLNARLFAVIDVYDALTSERCYKAEGSHEQATQVIAGDSGSHFDPMVVDSFLKVPASDWQILRHTATCLGGLKDVARACRLLADMPAPRMIAY